MAFLRLVPVLALLLGLSSWSVDVYRARQADARVYHMAANALENGDLLTAQSLFAQAGNYADAPRRSAAVSAEIAPYLANYEDGISALGSGDYDTAIALLEKVASALPGYGDVDALIAQARTGQDEQLRADARRAYAAQDWLLAEQLFSRLAALHPDDAEIAATLTDLRGNHALFVFTQHGILMRAVPGSAAAPTPVIDGPTASWPVWSPDRSKIAFISPGDANNGMARGLFVVDPDGSHLKKLADFPAQYQPPVWSPDGTRIAITVDRVTAQHVSMRPSVIVIDVATGAALDVVERALPNASSPTWSPAGDRIAYVSRAVEHLKADSSVPDEILRVDRSSVYVYDFATKHTTNVGGDALPEPYKIAWSPVADQILVYARMDGTSFNKGKLYLADVMTNAVTLVDGASVDVSMPVWSPDGSQFAYVVGSRSVRIVTASGGKVTLDAPFDLAGTLAWSPSGDRILAAGATATAKAALAVLGSAGGSIVAIELVYDADGGDAGPPDWAGLRGTSPAANPSTG